MPRPEYEPAPEDPSAVDGLYGYGPVILVKSADSPEAEVVNVAVRGCLRCGAAVGYRDVHDEWHLRQGLG